jgi:glutathione S-transferase
MILYGSTTSPYVRRLRLWLADREYTFEQIAVFENQYRADFAHINPVMKVPALVEGDQVYFDSNVIAEYCHDKYGVGFLHMDEKNILALINGVLDSMVQVLILSREQITSEQAPIYTGLREQRAQLCFAHLEKLLGDEWFTHWDYLTISLYTMLDWVVFRQMTDFSAYPRLTAFYEEQQKRADVQATDPRL